MGLSSATGLDSTATKLCSRMTDLRGDGHGMNVEIRRHPLSASGRYYVDRDTCVHHNCCIEVAPNNFRMSEHLTAYVFKQPGTSDEEAQCREALEICPTAAIHNDGEG